MNIQNIRVIKLLVVIPLLFLLASCAAGNEQFTAENPAGFWWGLWHGVIAVIALVIHIFNDNVLVYEFNNTGGWYDFGFLMGVIMIWGGGSHANCQSARKKQRDKEWDETCGRVETKVMRKLKDWAADEEGGDTTDEWDDIGEKVEKKFKRKIREWADKE